jgi:Icc-related predicted phosphoesterase
VKILLVSDLHYTLPQLDWILAAADDHDLVAIAGDLLDAASAVPVDAQVIVTVRWLEELRTRVPVVLGSGNHDLTGRDANGEKAALWMSQAAEIGVVVDGDSLELDSTLITVCPWWDGQVGRSAVEAQFAADAPRRTERWLWVYHWPPDGSPTCWTGTKHYGDPDLLGWIQQHHPDIVLTGHVHDPPFMPAGAWADRVGTTWVFNAGRQLGPVPAHIELDLAAGRATWRSLMGTEEQDLGADPPDARPSFG